MGDKKMYQKAKRSLVFFLALVAVSLFVFVAYGAEEIIAEETSFQAESTTLIADEMVPLAGSLAEISGSEFVEIDLNPNTWKGLLLIGLTSVAVVLGILAKKAEMK